MIIATPCHAPVHTAPLFEAGEDDARRKNRGLLFSKKIGDIRILIKMETICPGKYVILR